MAHKDGALECRRPGCGHPLSQHDEWGCRANVSPQALIDYDQTQATARCDCVGFREFPVAERIAVTLEAPGGERGTLIGPADKLPELVRPEAVVELVRDGHVAPEHAAEFAQQVAEYLADDVDVAACRVCGCTEDRACPGGCWWVLDPEQLGDLCSACAQTSGLRRPEPVMVGHVSPSGRLAPEADRPAGDSTSGRMWTCFCGAEVPSWGLQDHLIGHSR